MDVRIQRVRALISAGHVEIHYSAVREDLNDFVAHAADVTAADLGVTAPDALDRFREDVLGPSDVEHFTLGFKAKLE